MWFWTARCGTITPLGRPVEPEEPLAAAAARMREEKVGCLPVLAGRELVGILTEGDFLSLLAA